MDAQQQHSGEIVFRGRPRFNKPSAEKLEALRQRVQASSSAAGLLPENASGNWELENAGTFGVIFVDKRRGLALKVTRAGIIPGISTEHECKHEIMEYTVYRLLKHISASRKASYCAQFLHYYDAGCFVAEDKRLHCFVIMDSLSPAPNMSDLVSVQLGSPDPYDASFIREGPPATNSAGQNMAKGWLNVTGFGFAAMVGRQRAESCIEAVGSLIGYVEAFGLFLKDVEFIWAVAGNGREPKLNIVDFDKAVFVKNDHEIETLRKSDPVYPRRRSVSGPNERYDPFAAAFYKGFEEGSRRAQLASPKTAKLQQYAPKLMEHHDKGGAYFRMLSPRSSIHHHPTTTR